MEIRYTTGTTNLTCLSLIYFKFKTLDIIKFEQLFLHLLNSNTTYCATKSFNQRFFAISTTTKATAKNKTDYLRLKELRHTWH